MFDAGLTIGLGTLLVVIVVHFALGTLLGWWLKTPVVKIQPTDRGELDVLIEQQQSRAAEMDDALRQLQVLTGNIGQNVGEHANTVQAIGEELVVAQRDGHVDMQSLLMQAVSKVTQANEQLQEQLHEAEERLAENARALENQMAVARTDGLTGLLNRRAFDDELARRVAEYHRYHTPVTLLLGDIDHFKKFNDSHGHQAGDAVLKSVAQSLSKAMRDVDLVCRYGGEEFAVIMPATASSGGRQAAERARAAIESALLEFEGKTFRVTMSSGITSAMEGDAAASMIRRADEALYASKKAGRNCTHFHDGAVCLPANEPVPPAIALQQDAVTPEDSASKAVDDPGSLDPLQAIPNRKALIAELDRRIDQNHRFNTPLTLSIITVDNLNQFETDYGPEAKSRLLRATVKFLNATIRETETLARIDDNHLALVTPGTDQAKVVQALGCVRMAIEKCRVSLGETEVGFTISAGLALLDGTEQGEAFLTRTMAVLDVARLEGGNRIRVENETAEPSLAKSFASSASG